ncbi:hypothetical protein [Lentilactobacillus hilgardii]|uniref:hypothetical protein n=1 Tax=Lentilactobacillus hilgardii TaxID=1588 RepID=UPI00390C9411
MSKTMKQLTTEFGVTRQAIMRKMDKKFRNKYVSKVHSNGVSKLMISDDGYSLLKQYFSSSNKNVSNKDVSNSSEVTHDNIKLAMALLEKQLDKKDQQINKLQQSLSEAHKLLDQQQQLNLSSQKLLENQKSEQNIKNDTTQSRENDSKDDKSKPDTNISKQNEKPSNETRESFWKRLFR